MLRILTEHQMCINETCKEHISHTKKKKELHCTYNVFKHFSAQIY